MGTGEPAGEFLFGGKAKDFEGKVCLKAENSPIPRKFWVSPIMRKKTDLLTASMPGGHCSFLPCFRASDGCLFCPCRRRTEKKCCRSSTFLLSWGLCEENVIQLICCALIHGRGAVGVSVHGSGDVSMADTGLDSFHVDASFDHHGSTAMAQIMDKIILMLPSSLFRNTRGFDCGFIRFRF